MEFLKDQYWGLFFLVCTINDLPTIPKSENTESYVDDTKTKFIIFGTLSETFEFIIKEH